VYGTTTHSRDVVHLVDDSGSAASIARHLAEIGRRCIAQVTGPRRARAVEQRVLGLGHALAEHGMRLVGDVAYGEWSQRWARQAARDLLLAVPDLGAIVCGSDQLAAAVLEVVVASGRKVPDDAAITGYDNWPVFAQEADPALTTLDMELEQLGASAVSDLFAMIGGSRVGGGSRHHEGTLVVRGSTGPSRP
jgi:LacI family transcriptional regulator